MRTYGIGGSSPATLQYYVYWEVKVDSQLIGCIVVVSCSDSAPWMSLAHVKHFQSVAYLRQTTQATWYIHHLIWWSFKRDFVVNLLLCRNSALFPLKICYLLRFSYLAEYSENLVKSVGLLWATWLHHVYWELEADSHLIECIVVVRCSDWAPWMSLACVKYFCQYPTQANYTGWRQRGEHDMYII